MGKSLVAARSRSAERQQCQLGPDEGPIPVEVHTQEALLAVSGDEERGCRGRLSDVLLFGNGFLDCCSTGLSRILVVELMPNCL